MFVITNGNIVINVDSDADLNNRLAAGWALLTPEQIAAAGMSGYEHFVSPANTVVHEDGSITFTQPTPPSESELVERLRLAAEQRLADTDQYGMDDYPDNAKRAAFRDYRTALREINRQPGAPWDGGGELTPWPVMPTVE